MHPGERIRAAREARGVTQRQLAEHLGVTPSYVSHLESGERNITTEMAARIGRFLNVRPAVLMNEAASGAPFARVMRTLSEDTRTGIEMCTRLHSNLWDLEEMLYGRPVRGPLLRYEDGVMSPTRAAKETRIQLGWTMRHIADQKGIMRQLALVHITVFEIPLPSTLAGICTRDPPPAIFLNANLSARRRLYTLAVQLGHLVLHGGGSTPTERPRRVVREEAEAEEYAYEFLLPAELVKELAWLMPDDRRIALPWLGIVTGLDPAMVLCRLDQLGRAPKGRHADIRHDLLRHSTLTSAPVSFDPRIHLPSRYQMLCYIAWESGMLDTKKLADMFMVDEKVALEVCDYLRGSLASDPDAAYYESPVR